MLTLYLFRHAKSAWDDPSLADFDRPLATRGESAAPAMAAYMKAKGLQPDLVLCSAARRTRDTWALMAGTLGQPRTTYLDEIYEAEPSALATTIRRAPSDARRLMLIGHNPGLEDLAHGLIASGDRDGRKALAEKFPTAALAVIDFDIETWRDLAPATGRLTLFMTPKRLP
ncbi:MAG TPA: histidine phosphatase family protein [Hyphomicrobiaceae bacterium]